MASPLARLATGDTSDATSRQALTRTQATAKNTRRTTVPTRCPAAATGFCQDTCGRQRGCGGSSENASGALPLSELSMGIRVTATSSETPTAIAIVSAWSPKSWPAIPSTNTSGRNTAMMVSVEATTAIATSRVPSIADATIPSPRSRALAMLSSTTIESSTTSPAASARPLSDMTFRLRPSWSMRKNVVMIDTGSDRPTTRVLQRAAQYRVDLDVADGRADELRLVVDHGQADVRGQAFAQVGDARVHRVGGGHGVGIALLVDGQLDRLAPVQADDRLALLVVLAHRGDIAQAHRPAVGNRAAAGRRRALRGHCRGQHRGIAGRRCDPRHLVGSTTGGAGGLG